MPQDKCVYPVPPQEENKIVPFQTQNDDIDESNDQSEEQMVVDLKKEELSITIENNTTDDTIEKPDLFQIEEKIKFGKCNEVVDQNFKIMCTRMMKTSKRRLPLKRETSQEKKN